MLKKGLDTVKIGDTTLVSTSKKRLLRFLASRIDQAQKTFVTTPNPEFLIYAKENPWFKAVLNKANIAVPDGIGLLWAGKILGQPIKERISGTDLIGELCVLAAKKGWNVYFFGGEQGTAREAFLKLKKRYSGLEGWSDSGPRLELIDGKWPTASVKEARKTIQKINAKKPDLLFVALGMGKQEKFISDNWEELEVKLAMGIGGAFDYFSGRISRAPRWIREIGLEWLYRLIREPWRWKRQLRLLKFVWWIGLCFIKKQ